MEASGQVSLFHQRQIGEPSRMAAGNLSQLHTEAIKLFIVQTVLHGQLSLSPILQTGPIAYMETEGLCFYLLLLPNASIVKMQLTGWNWRCLLQQAGMALLTEMEQLWRWLTTVVKPLMP